MTYKLHTCCGCLLICLILLSVCLAFWCLNGFMFSAWLSLFHCTMLHWQILFYMLFGLLVSASICGARVSALRVLHAGGERPQPGSCGTDPRPGARHHYHHHCLNHQFTPLSPQFGEQPSPLSCHSLHVLSSHTWNRRCQHCGHTCHFRVAHHCYQDVNEHTLNATLHSHCLWCQSSPLMGSSLAHGISVWSWLLSFYLPSPLCLQWWKCTVTESMKDYHL